jgi:hypothetical protein
LDRRRISLQYCVLRRAKNVVRQLGIVHPVVALPIGPPDAAFARGRRLNVFMVLLFGLLSGKIIRKAKGWRCIFVPVRASRRRATRRDRRVSRPSASGR